MALLQEPTIQTLLVPVADPVRRQLLLRRGPGDNCHRPGRDGKGWAMVLDENPELAAKIAILDAAFAAGIEREAVVALMEHGKKRYEQKARELAGQVEATRVSFDLM